MNQTNDLTEKSNFHNQLKRQTSDTTGESPRSNASSTITPKRFVEFRRQIFEPSSPHQQIKQQPSDSPTFQPKPYTTSDELLNKQSAPFYFNQYSPVYPPNNETVHNPLASKTPSSASLPTNKNQSADNTSKTTIKSTSIQLNNIRASSLGVANDYQPPSSSAISVTNSSFQPRSVSSHFNHFNRASYKGECRRLMSRANMETVAERAARFEEIDIERYKRMKNRLNELELLNQKEAEIKLNHIANTTNLLINSGNHIETDLNKVNKKNNDNFNLANLLNNLKPVVYEDKNNKGHFNESFDNRLSANSMVDSIVNDYFSRNDVYLKKNNQEHDLSWKYEPHVAKYYTGEPCFFLFFVYFCLIDNFNHR